MAISHMPVRLSVRTQNEGAQTPCSTVLPGLTPPVTPTVDDDSLSGSEVTVHSNSSSPLLSPVDANPEESIKDVSEPKQFTDNLEYQYDPKGRPVEFGRGVWSVVYKASSFPAVKSGLLTPPSSPAFKGRVVAVKSPVRRDAHSVLDAEARALTQISRVAGAEHHIVPFHGYISESHSIVMSAVPLALSTYIQDKAATAQKNRSTQTMFDPVSGMVQWRVLAEKLIAGLAWLHRGPQMVHGDIKPHNILLRLRSPGGQELDLDSDSFPYEPLFADFSSAHPIASPSSPEQCMGTALTALTPPFAAPELLCVSSLTSPDVAPTPESDVFSLAVSLLAAATGDLLLYPGASNLQRLAMAREGHRVIDFARSGPNGSRVPRAGVVEQIIKPAIAKDPSQRVYPADWLHLAESVH
ncbi:protein kinase domain-containing protein [Aspergillus saccharolyticus JOP 1030-1]|uniref:Kinase-like protein n=1 Tax=Aspergillus saccharolyticus JOP 1030-1 TaxID=1450539 RepID=A0A318ZK62_9EURO|nr:kinase-like protein [Aspergillus saccharolyticus JOP 1030-1]PYH47896.1 kinase-like protein [Aspergillus saccharolyticus JOP 1030-1]